MNISTNTTSLQEILEIVNSLPQTITSTTDVTEGSASSYPESSLYVVYEE
jgi:hypothetical protein